MENFFSTGQSFVNWYYNTLNSKPEEIKRVYCESSVVSFNGKNFQGKNENGNLKIVDFLNSEEMKKSKYMVIHFAAQPSISNCILILVHGIVIPDESKPKIDFSFEDAFFVNVSEEKEYYMILNHVHALSD